MWFATTILMISILGHYNLNKHEMGGIIHRHMIVVSDAEDLDPTTTETQEEEEMVARF